MDGEADSVKRALYSDLTEPQRQAVIELAEAEMEDSPAWVSVNRFHKWTVRKLRALDLAVVSDTGIDEAKLRITGRGMEYYKSVLISRPKRDKLTDDDIREIILMSDRGDPQYEIAEKFGITQTHVSNIRRGTYPKPARILKEMGLNPKSVCPRYPKRIRRLALRMRREGKSYEEICNTLDVSQGALGKWIRDAGMVVEGHVSDDTRRRIVRMSLSGMTYQQIADEMGRSTRLVKNAMNAFYAGVLDVQL